MIPNPIEGPSDLQFRIGAGACLPIVLIGMVVAFATWNGPNAPRLFVLAIGPFAAFYSIAALIDPNVVRAAGKFGTHLPTRYKLIAGLVGVAALLAASIIVLPLLLR